MNKVKNKDEELIKKGWKCHEFQNGNSLYLLNSEFKSSPNQYLTLKDRNGKEIKKIEFPPVVVINTLQF